MKEKKQMMCRQREWGKDVLHLSNLYLRARGFTTVWTSRIRWSDRDTLFVIHFYIRSRKCNIIYNSGRIFRDCDCAVQCQCPIDCKLIQKEKRENIHLYGVPMA